MLAAPKDGTTARVESTNKLLDFGSSGDITTRLLRVAMCQA